MKKELQKKLNRYNQLAKGVNKNLKPVAKASLALGGSFLAAIPVSEGAIVYSGVQNLSVVWSAGGSPPNAFQSIDINGGGNDIRFFGQNSGGLHLFQLNDAGGDLNGVNGKFSVGYVYPYANATTAVFDGADPWQVKNTNTIAVGAYAGNDDGWDNLPVGQTRIAGIRLVGDFYGWVRITKNGDRDWTIVDWAYETDANVAISPSTTLPVSLISFSGKVKDKAASLYWNTASEKDNSGFEVQRSTDGSDFETIAFVEGAGTAYDEQEYFYDDKELRQNQIYYYRLKQIDYSGQFEYSDVIMVEVEGSKTAISNFYPNPTEGITNIEYTANVNTELVITVFSTTGQELLRETRNVGEGLNNLNFNFSELGKGNYFIKLQAGDDINYEKLIIK